jgi:hypothetical protein
LICADADDTFAGSAFCTAEATSAEIFAMIVERGRPLCNSDAICAFTVLVVVDPVVSVVFVDCVTGLTFERNAENSGAAVAEPEIESEFPLLVAVLADAGCAPNDDAAMGRADAM